MDWFSFENRNLDFPIYNKNPHVPKWGWIVLLISIFAGYILLMSPSVYVAFLSMAIPLVTLLYFLKWDVHAIFQKPKAKEIGLAVALFAGYIVYSVAIMFVLGYFGIGADSSPADPVTLMSIPPLFFTLMTEELIKFIPFMFFLRVFYKYSGNRKLSVMAAMIIVMIFFAALHAFDLNTLIFAIIVQGFGSIFEFIGYIKTKNIWISYITHLCTDLFIFMLILSGLA